METGSTIWKLLIFWQVLCFARTLEDSGFIFTAPRKFLSGYDENVCITFKNQTQKVKVSVTILQQKEDIEIASAAAKITETDNGSKCFKVPIPRTKVKKGRLHLTIHLTSEGDFKINYIEQISIQTDPDITFIQTDKPVYNGGQLVRLRIFTIRSDLTPVLQPVDKVWIENPQGQYLAQWLNESSTNNGFINKTFQLSNDPMPGIWHIRIQRRGDEIVSKDFRVQNYVLPRFSVTITSQEVVNFPEHDLTICAKYLFGEPVSGKVILQYYVECLFSFYCPEKKSAAVVNLKLDANGCVDHKITVKDLSIYAERIIVNATVIEDGTRMKGTGDARIDIRNIRKKHFPEFIPGMRKFKPGLPYKGRVILKGKMQDPERISICVNANNRITCREIIMNENTIEFLILPIPIEDIKTFRAFLEVRSLRNNSSPGIFPNMLSLSTWYSPSGSYLQVENLSNGPVRCNRPTKFRVLFATSEFPSLPQFHYMVKARGDILNMGVLDKVSQNLKPYQTTSSNVINQGDISRVMQFDFSIEITTKMSPRIYLLVYFIRNDGEIVADTLNLKVENCFLNKVNTEWRKPKVHPGLENTFSIEASSNSICALTITDRGTKLLEHSDDLNEERVFKDVEKYEVGVQSPVYEVSRCKKHENTNNTGNNMDAVLQRREPHSRFLDSLQAFNDFGGLVITDLNLETRPCMERLTGAASRNSLLNTNGIEAENISIFTADDFPDVPQPKPREHPAAYELRTFFPETWIWDFVHIETNGATDMSFMTPHTITEWTAETVCLSLDKGLGVAEPKKFVTYKPFFIDYTLPHSLKRKETFFLIVSVFNYESNDMPIKVTYNLSNGFILKSNPSHSSCVKPKSKGVHRFILEAIKLGKAKIMVTAEIDTNFTDRCGPVISAQSDTVVKTTVIEHEGFPVEKVKSGFICGESSKFKNQTSWTLRIPAEVIDSSISVEGAVSGDILGPTLKNTDHLITLPTGCGEQNMILLVPNILLLDYLLYIKSEDTEPIEKALKYLDLGYQRQSNYKLHDGSYSAFGEQDGRGSIWLTAFVVRYISQAKKYIFVDSNDLNTSVSWIIKQQLENGCFPLIGKVYHRKLQEKLMEEDSSKTVTAYILISLMEAGMSLDNPAVKNAIFCLKPEEESSGLYADLLSAYALILAGKYRESQGLMLELLREAKRSYGMLWWENDDSIESSIEMTGYGILTLIKLGGPMFIAAASDAIRWMIQYQNENGGFLSSQDTIVALEAISKFSSTLPRASKHDTLSIQLQTKEQNHTFNISHSNKMLQQKVNLPSYATDVRFESTGRGCALVQTWLKYNVRRGKLSDNFKIQLRINSVSDVDPYSITKLYVCIRNKGPEKINMAVLEVFMVSGYYPDRASLFEIRTSKNGVRRWEEYEDRVNFYFEDLKNKKVCVEFLITQEACVEQSAPALIKLYDYYNTQEEATLRYNIISNCQNRSWLNDPLLKKRPKRELISNNYDYQEENNNNGFQNFVNVDHELETPRDEEVLPVYALPPPTNSVKAKYCVHCPTEVPDIFPNLYCSSVIAVKVLVLGREILEFHDDLSPRKNVTSINRTVFFTVREDCDCPILNSVNTFALLLVTPPRYFSVQSVRELHMDDSIQLYQWEKPNQIPEYLQNAMNYCKRDGVYYNY